MLPSDHGAQGRRFDTPRGHSLFAFNLATMKKFVSCAHSVSVVYLINVKWQLVGMGVSGNLTSEI